jgi:hypothetical protein
VGAGCTQQVDYLLIDGVSQFSGTWGHSGSGATFTNDNFFAGLGVLSVGMTNIAPVVNSAGGATFTGFDTATLSGNLTTGTVANIYICWGLNDEGATSTSSWSHVISLGALGNGAFSANLSGLATNTTYYYRCFAQNPYGSDWSDTAVSFSGKPASGMGASWSPTNLQMAAWFDASDTSKLTTNGVLVSQLNDKSGNNRHLTQTNSLQQPALSPWQGRSAIQIVNTGTNGDRLVSASDIIADADDFTIVSVLQGTCLGRGADTFGDGWSKSKRQQAVWFLPLAVRRKSMPLLRFPEDCKPQSWTKASASSDRRTGASLRIQSQPRQPCVPARGYLSSGPAMETPKPVILER